MKTNKDLGILIIRLTIGVLMLMHGLPKLFNGVAGIEGMLANVGLPKFFALGVHVGETLAPILIIAGFRTKLASIIFAFNCLVAIFLAHSADIFAMGKYGGWALELLGLYLLGSVALIFSGGGKYALSKANSWD